MPTTESSTDLVPTAPHAVLEGGGETIAVLLAAAVRSLEDMVTGQVLHIVSSTPSVGDCIAAWCGDAGHELVRAWAQGEEGQYWVRKG